MNFSRFDDLLATKETDKIQNKEAAACVTACKNAEMHARLQPGATATYARGALDILFRIQSRINKLHPDGLADSIIANCACIEKDGERIREMADEIRRAGNKAVHRNIKKGEDVDAATKANVTRAIEICKALYGLMEFFFGDRGEFDPEQVPFMELEILRRVADSAAVSRDVYFVRQKGDGEEYCYYLQCLSILETVVLEARRQEASMRVYRQRKRNSRILLPNIQPPVPQNSDRKVLVYNTFDDSELLSELKKGMSVKEALNVGLNLCEALLDMKDAGLHHRNLYPGSVLLERSGAGWEAYLLDLQTSKILGSDNTIQHRLAAAWDCNFYIPEAVKTRMKEATEDSRVKIDWERVDAYSLCLVVLFCMDRKLTLTKTRAKLAAYAADQFLAPFTEAFLDLYERIFAVDGEFSSLPTLEEVQEVFENERRYAD